MGYTSARDIRAWAKEEVALEWHLRSNHYPPFPLALVATAREALRMARQKDDPNTPLGLPKGITFRGRTKISLREAIESMHLEAFLDE